MATKTTKKVKKTTATTTKTAKAVKTKKPVKKSAKAVKKPVAKVVAPEAVANAPVAISGPYIEAIGRRKTAIARVRLTQDAKKETIEFTVNTKPLKTYFPVEEFSNIAFEPFTKTKREAGFSVSVHVYGGGIRGQAEATRLGLARAMLKLQPELRNELKVFGLLTRDPRMVERKKPGLKKARRAAQWSKR